MRPAKVAAAPEARPGLGPVGAGRTGGGGPADPPDCRAGETSRAGLTSPHHMHIPGDPELGPDSCAQMGMQQQRTSPGEGGELGREYLRAHSKAVPGAAQLLRKVNTHVCACTELYAGRPEPWTCDHCWVSKGRFGAAVKVMGSGGSQTWV